MKKFIINIDELMSMDRETVKTMLKILDNVRYSIVETALNNNLKANDMNYLSGGKDFAEQLYKEIADLYNEVSEIKRQDALKELRGEDNE